MAWNLNKVAEADDYKETVDMVDSDTSRRVAEFRDYFNNATPEEQNRIAQDFDERVNKHIPKDRFSAFEYGLWYLKLEEDKLKQTTISITDFILGTKNANRRKRNSRVYTRRRKRNE